MRRWNEIERVHKAIQPNETLFVDNDRSRCGKYTAKLLMTGFDGVILTN
jgi:hypothetical protein